MYIIIPIGILVLALGGIAYIVGRKLVYLRKLTPEAISNPPPTAATFWEGLFPEVVSLWSKINWREYRIKATTESEKLLRRLRLFFLKIESITHEWSLRLRKSTKKHEEILVQEEEVKLEEAAVPVVPIVDPKEEEQHLIMEIAKDPKDPLLYIRLGDIYLKTGDKENARASFETVLQLDPENWYAKGKLKQLPQKIEKPE
ncbi:MAG: tetratricopeptide repeat protein [Patescibacteria group bacterium]